MEAKISPRPFAQFTWRHISQWKMLSCDLIICTKDRMLFIHIWSVRRKSGHWLKIAEMNKMQFIAFVLCSTSWSSVPGTNDVESILVVVFFLHFYHQEACNGYRSKRINICLICFCLLFIQHFSVAKSLTRKLIRIFQLS